MKRRQTSPEGRAQPVTVPQWKVENVVATVELDFEKANPEDKIDLNTIARKYGDVEYNPERFPGLVMRVEEPKATSLIFSTGKMVVTGLRRAEEAPLAVKVIVEKLDKARVKIKKEPTITVQNIVASGKLESEIDLNEAAITMDNSMYEPEVFPGLIYRMWDPKTVFLLFSTGKFVCTGAKSNEMVGGAVKKLAETVASLGLHFNAGEEMADVF